MKVKTLVLLMCVAVGVSWFTLIASASNAAPADPAKTPLNGKIIVNDKVIEAPTPFYNELGAVMIPIVEVAENLGYTTVPNEDGGVSLGSLCRISAGDAFYEWRESVTVWFEPSPELLDGHIFVPLTFIKHGLKGYETALSEDGSVIITQKKDTVVWYEPDNVHSALYSDEMPDEAFGIDIDTKTMQTGKTHQGGDIFSLLRIPLGADFSPGDIDQAKLFMKVIGDVPPAILLGTVTSPWDAVTLTRPLALESIGPLTYTPVTDEGDGWVSVDATDIVKEWLNGTENNGFALFGLEDGDTYVFVSGNSDGGKDVPYMEVTGSVDERAQIHGAFTYAYDAAGYGLAYALRDNDQIQLSDLTEDMNALNVIFSNEGDDALADSIGALIEAYLDANKESLHITGFRRLDAYDAEIDPSTEYRIALRAGGKKDDDEITLGFHCWVQLDDGRWAQQFEGEYPEIVPGSAHDVDPGASYWYGGRIWNSNQIRYTSDIIYYAVTKNTIELTSHRPAPATTRERRADRGRTDAPEGVTIIGDSVSLGAQTMLVNTLNNCVVDSAVSRQISDGLSILEEYQKDGKLREYVVIALGTNGSYSYDKLITQIIGTLNTGHRLIFVTPFDGRANDNHKSTNEVSEWMRTLPDQYEFVTIADWNAAVKNQTSILASDKVHMGTGSASRELYTACISEAIEAASNKPAK